MSDRQKVTLESVRSLFPVCQAHVYLNNAGVAPTSVPVQQAVNRWIDDLAHHGVSGEARWEQQLDEVRASAADLLGATAAEITFVRNTSHGLALVAEGLDWRDGDEVAVCMQVEYPSNVYPWQHLAHRGVRTVAIEPHGGGVTVDAVREVLTERTRLVTVSAVQYASGHRTDLAALGQLCHERGILLCVDGIQQVGALPLDVQDLGIHFLSADSHKWMLGLPGAGIMFVRADVIEQLRPPLVGWRSTTDAWNFDRAHFELRSDVIRLEEGTPAYPLNAGLGAAIEVLLDISMPKVAAYIQELVQYAASELLRIGCDVGPSPQHRACSLSVMPAGDPNDALARCAADRVEVSLRRGRIRISPHVYNNREDIDRLVAAMGS